MGHWVYHQCGHHPNACTRIILHKIGESPGHAIHPYIHTHHHKYFDRTFLSLACCRNSRIFAFFLKIAGDVIILCKLCTTHSTCGINIWQHQSHLLIKDYSIFDINWEQRNPTCHYMRYLLNHRIALYKLEAWYNVSTQSRFQNDLE